MSSSASRHAGRHGCGTEEAVVNVHVDVAREVRVWASHGFSLSCPSRMKTSTASTTLCAFKRSAARR